MKMSGFIEWTRGFLAATALIFFIIAAHRTVYNTGNEREALLIGAACLVVLMFSDQLERIEQVLRNKM